MNWRIFLLYVIGYLLANSCTSKTEIIKLDLKASYSQERMTDYFMISNPPEKLEDIISLVNKNLNKSLDDKENQIDRVKFYSQIYYKERYFFNSRYKPHYKWYNPYIYDDIRDGQSHFEDRYVAIILKDDRYSYSTAPNMPIYFLYSKKLYYYPNGFRNDPNKHWEKMKD